jgi:L-ascorbate metabolism protein UlaG (beta-lactamase superfamily)
MSEGASIDLRWHGVACVELRWQDQRLLFDPYLTASRPDDVGLILVSHGHFDHVRDAAAVALASGATVVAPRAALLGLHRAGLDWSLLRACEQTESIPFGAGRVRVLPSRHIRFDARLIARTALRVIRAGKTRELLRLHRRHPMGSNSDFLLELGDERVLFSGSGGGDTARLAALKPTTYLLPFAGRSDVVDRYLRVLGAMRPRRAILHHWDDFMPGFSEPYPVEELRRRAAVELPETEIVIPVRNEWMHV